MPCFSTDHFERWRPRRRLLRIFRANSAERVNGKLSFIKDVTRPLLAEEKEQNTLFAFVILLDNATIEGISPDRGVDAYFLHDDPLLRTSFDTAARSAEHRRCLRPAPPPGWSKDLDRCYGYSLGFHSFQTLPTRAVPPRRERRVTPKQDRPFPRSRHGVWSPSAAETEPPSGIRRPRDDGATPAAPFPAPCLVLLSRLRLRMKAT